MIKKILGKDVFLSINGEVVALSTQCALTVNCEFVEVAPQVDARAREVLPDRYSWSASFDALIAEDGQHVKLLNAMTKGVRVFLTVGRGMVLEEDGGGGPFCGSTGYAYFRNYEEQAPVGTMHSFRASLIGDGPLNPINEFE